MTPIYIHYRGAATRDQISRIVTEREIRHHFPDIEQEMLESPNPGETLDAAVRNIAGITAWSSDWQTDDFGHFILDRIETFQTAAAELLS